MIPLRPCASQCVHTVARAPGGAHRAYVFQAIQVTQAEVKSWFASWWPEALASARASLCVEIADCLTRHRVPPTAPGSPSTDDESSDETPQVLGASANSVQEPSAPSFQYEAEVSNALSLKRHRVLLGHPDYPSADWTTICGWRFGSADHAIWPDSSHTECKICF